MEVPRMLRDLSQVTLGVSGRDSPEPLVGLRVYLALSKPGDAEAGITPCWTGCQGRQREGCLTGDYVSGQSLPSGP